MPASPKVFLSAVSSEFKAEREQLRDWLHKKSVHIVEQSDFVQGGGTLWEYLKGRIADCPAGVCLIGAQSGSDIRPAEAPDGSPPRTYTQWEFWLGWGEKPWSPPRRQRVLVYFPGDLDQRLAAAETAAQGDPAAETRLRLQREHILKVKETGAHYETFTDLDHLIKLCLAQDVLCQRAKKRIGLAVALAVLIGMVWAVLSNQGKIAGQQTRDTAKLDAIAEGQKSDHALLERFIKAQGGAASLSIGQVGESGYERALRIVADEKKISVDEARKRLTATATAVQRDPAATLFDQAKAAFALKDFAKAHTLATQAAEKQSADLADKWTLAGQAAVEQGKYREAVAAFEKALALRDEAKAPVEWANSANWLAIWHYRLAAYAKAEPLYRRALETMERTLGPEHPKTLSSIHCLGILLRDKGDLAGAEEWVRRALAGYEKVLLPEHPWRKMAEESLAQIIAKRPAAGE